MELPLDEMRKKDMFFTTILEDYYEYVFHFVLKQVRDLEDAKDITQDIFLKVHKHLDKYDESKGSLTTWLFAIANNHIVSHWRKQKKQSITITGYDMDLLSDSVDILEDLIKADEVKIVVSTMRKYLSKRNFKIMNLYFFSEFSAKEIADILDMNHRTVSNIISLSINKIRERLEDKHGKV